MQTAMLCPTLGLDNGRRDLADVNLLATLLLKWPMIASKPWLAMFSNARAPTPPWITGMKRMVMMKRVLIRKPLIMRSKMRVDLLPSPLMLINWILLSFTWCCW